MKLWFWVFHPNIIVFLFIGLGIGFNGIEIDYLCKLTDLICHILLVLVVFEISGRSKGSDSLWKIVLKPLDFSLTEFFLFFIEEIRTDA